MSAPVLSIVIPVYNEAESLPELVRRVTETVRRIEPSFEILFINDGSRDETIEALRRLCVHDARLRAISFSRNFGKEIAMTAGLDHARGAAVVVIDADLQDPPEVIPELVAGWRGGFDVVYAQRRQRAGESWLKRTTADLFYRLMQSVGRVKLPRDTGDFRLMSRRAVDALMQLREHHRFMKGLFAWVGFPTLAVAYDRAPRFAGRTSFNYWKLWNLAIEGITSFTTMPLKLASYLGLLTAAVALVYGGNIVVRALLFGNPVPGYPSLMTVILFLGGAQLVTLGVMGEYLGRIFNETKGRPLYFVERFTPSRPMVPPDPFPPPGEPVASPARVP